MKAALLVDKQTYKLIEAPKPTLGDGETLIAVRMCGFCGSDLHDAARVPKEPKVPGHEFSGVIEEIRGDAMGFKVGEAVGANPLVNCGKCPFCLSGREHLCSTRYVTGCQPQAPGGFAEYVRVPTKTLVHMPKGMAFEIATLCDPLGVVLHAADLAGDIKGKTCLIFGAGTLGLFMLQVLKLRGAKSVAIVDIAQQRLNVAAKYKPDVIVNASTDPEHQAIKGMTFDIAVELAGAPPTLPRAMTSVDRGGTVLQVAQRPPTEIPCGPLCFREVRIQGVFGQTPVNFKQAMEMLGREQIDGRSLVTHTYTLDKIVEAFAMARSPESIKVVVKPN